MTQREPDEVMADAKSLAARVLQHNAVAYPQEIANKEWMAGYYLNNARYRLLNAREYISQPGTAREASGQQLLQVSHGRARDRWTELQDEADTLVKGLAGRAL